MLKIKWMTLIEVLITIVVFTSGILVILWVITSSLTIGSRSRNRTIATMLAKEWLEMMYSIRDTNLDKAQNWWCIPIASDSCGLDISGGWLYTLRIENTWLNIITVTDWAAIDKRMYTINNDWITTYTHSSTGQPSQFYRYITISTATIPWTQTIVNSNIKKIVSTVEYSQLWWTGKVELESFIGFTR